MIYIYDIYDLALYIVRCEIANYLWTTRDPVVLSYVVIGSVQYIESDSNMPTGAKTCAGPEFERF